MTKFDKTFKELMESVQFEDLQKEYSEKKVSKSSFITQDQCKKTFQDHAEKSFNALKNKDGNKKFIKAYFKNNDFNDRDCWFEYEENGKKRELSMKIDEFI
jgi:hypothetical protein